ncbi:MAG: UDP-glucose--hexose-1-phosphate uridylyltransferase [Bacteroidota bacterium]|nr:UDP-glucose--hexose-1-phosphate uridylyltransferase [Bacteroidota bacterium]MDP4191447.1 UDP-glucose--hexose-1-phosphate uridylyltransferase [Bacteroidota bacterium]MDP4194466.1 UDP-glucose--hexose-1-phosphate uridylyltransferase [Bacteroidota bacterium]
MLNENVHRRLNILTGEWILVSSQRTKRPWQGQVEKASIEVRNQYEAECYLCPGNKRSSGEINTEYDSTFVFTNDFSALNLKTPEDSVNEKGLIVAKSEKGTCRVVCFSPRHDLTIAEMEVDEIKNIVKAWKSEYLTLGSKEEINYVQIFENKGQVMGCSNPHPHGQIWAQETIPVEPFKEQSKQHDYYEKNRTSLLSDYLKLETEKKERIVYENDGFVLLVPFWAVWPFETMIIPRRHVQNLNQLTEEDISHFADILKAVTVKYDNIFNTSFPYSAGIHQSPTDGLSHSEWHMHMHFYPPLLRSATIKKFMVGYEMLANPQRDITAEMSAKILRDASLVHYRSKK